MEREENPYFRIFEGEAVSLKKILDHGKGFWLSVDQKIREGEIVGQFDLERDCILKLAKPLDNEVPQTVSEVTHTNGVLKDQYPLLRSLVGLQP